MRAEWADILRSTPMRMTLRLVALFTLISLLTFAATWWLANRALLDTPAARWGVQTDHERVLLCGSGARRGGAVSGLGGHNAAQAALESR